MEFRVTKEGREGDLAEVTNRSAINRQLELYIFEDQNNSSSKHISYDRLNIYRKKFTCMQTLYVI